MGIVVLDHLRQKCPVDKNDVISKGGEIKGARSGLGNVLQKYGIPTSYLKEATTRQSHQDGQKLFERLAWGSKLIALNDAERDALLLEMVETLSSRADAWLKRQNLKFDIDRRQAPTHWINLIVESAKQRSGGVVEQHLVGAKLERRFLDKSIPNHPAHAGDVQTAREGDFTISNLVYHVTAAPSRHVVQKCEGNIRIGLHPILLVPREQLGLAQLRAQDEGVEKELTIIAIEDFVALNIIELSASENKNFYTVLHEIVQIYNRRLSEVETDVSLQIQIR
jgi:hypothetical protein